MKKLLYVLSPLVIASLALTACGGIPAWLDQAEYFSTDHQRLEVWVENQAINGQFHILVNSHLGGDIIAESCTFKETGESLPHAIETILQVRQELVSEGIMKFTVFCTYEGGITEELQVEVKIPGDSESTETQTPTDTTPLPTNTAQPTVTPTATNAPMVWSLTKDCPDFSVQIDLVGVLFSNAFCIDDGYTVSFTLQDGGQLNVTVNDTYQALKVTTVGSQTRTEVQCDVLYEGRYRCSGEYQFDVTVSKDTITGYILTTECAEGLEIQIWMNFRKFSGSTPSCANLTVTVTDLDLRTLRFFLNSDGTLRTTDVAICSKVDEYQGNLYYNCEVVEGYFTFEVLRSGTLLTPTPTLTGLITG